MTKPSKTAAVIMKVEEAGGQVTLLYSRATDRCRMEFRADGWINARLRYNTGDRSVCSHLTVNVVFF